MVVYVLMQFLAMLTMLIDHVGQVYFPDDLGWRLVGRVAFPIYAYYIVMGYRYTNSVTNYMNRLLILALISQVPFMIALNQISINAIGTLYVCLVVLYLIDRKCIWKSVLISIAAAIIMELLKFDYGSYGLMLVLIFRYTRGLYLIVAHLILILIFAKIKESWSLQIFSIVSTVVIIYGPKLYAAFERRIVPKWIWRGFYPVHLALIAIFKVLL